MRQILSILLLAIFSLQIIPVKEIGGILYKGLISEEMHESDVPADETDNEVKKEAQIYTSAYSQTFSIERHIHIITDLLIRQCNHYESGFVPDISTPPPNFSC